MSSRSLASGASRWWIAYLAAGAAVVVAYFALLSTDAQEFAYQLPGMLAPLAVLAGVAIHRPSRPWPWLALAAGLVFTVTGDWTWVVLDRVYGVEPFPSVADLFYLSGIGLTGVAVLGLVRGRVPGGDRAGLIDALIVAVGVGLVSWVFIMEPLVAAGAESMTEIGVALAYPVLDILLLGVLVRLVLSPGRHVRALQLLVGALALLLVSDFPFAILAVEGGYHTGHLVEAGWLLAAFCWGAAALHPSMRQVAVPAEAGDARFSPVRLALLAGASLMAPAVLVLDWLREGPIDVPVIAAASVVLFLLVIARMGGVLSDLRRTLNQRRALEVELHHRALHDPLTGLANRALFQERLLGSLARRGGLRVAVLFIDLDDFKTVNDTQGHEAGDAVLVATAHALRDTVRAADVVARLGGDEFAVLLEDDPDPVNAGLLATRLIEAVRAAGAREALSFGASIGIGIGRAGSATAEQLMREADIAMYVSKGRGKGDFTIFDPALHDRVLRSLGLRADLDHAIEEGQFELAYQPIVALDTGDLVGVEALVRWRHPTRGLLLPAEFIPMAETTGAIMPLGRWILDEACRQAAAWAGTSRRPGSGPTSGGRFISVNLSAVQLLHSELLPTVRAALATSGLPAEQLILEITESARLEPSEAVAPISELREMGVRLAIDDFGTGYAAFAQLAQTTFDLLKIDRSLVAALADHDDPQLAGRSEVLLEGVLMMARRLGAQVVAEGIETAGQLSRLRAVGCDFGQGHHLSPAVAAGELMDLVTGGAPAPARAARRKPHAQRSTPS